MFKSIFIKYMTAFMLIIMCCMFLLSVIISSIINAYSSDVRESTLKNATEYILNTVRDGMKKYELENDFSKYVGVYPEHLHTYLDAASINVEEINMLLFDEEGKMILAGGATSSKNFGGDDGMFDHSDEQFYLPESFMNALSESSQYSTVSNLGGIFDEEYMIYAMPLHDSDDKFMGAVIACSANEGVNRILDETVRTIIMSTLWLMLAVLVAVYFISERLIAPVHAMSKAAKSFAKGHFDVRINVRGNDEIAELADAFNNMADSLSHTEEMRRVFLANVSHDLRTPMTTISGFIDGILAGAIPPEKHEHYLGIIASEARRLSRLVSALLDITRIQAGERKFNMVPFDICEMCRQVLISSEQRIDSKKLEVGFICDNDNMYALGDTDAIHQIVYNIMDNGIKFAYEGGKYEVSIADTGANITVSVFNEGVGIPEEDLPYIFDRFYKSDKSRGLDKTGVGLGMYIARTIIEAHGQTIKVESEHGKWCRFTFTLAKTSASKNQNNPSLK